MKGHRVAVEAAAATGRDRAARFTWSSSGQGPFEAAHPRGRRRAGLGDRVSLVGLRAPICPRRWRLSTSRSTRRSSPTACRACSSSTWPPGVPVVATPRRRGARGAGGRRDRAARARGRAGPARRAPSSACCDDAALRRRGSARRGAALARERLSGARVAERLAALYCARRRLGAAGAVKISVLCFDLSDNAAGRAFLLARLLEPLGAVEIVGPRFGAGRLGAGRGRPVHACARSRAGGSRASPRACRRSRAQADGDLHLRVQAAARQRRRRLSRAPRGADGRCCSTSTTGRSASSSAAAVWGTVGPSAQPRQSRAACRGRG